MRILLDRQKHDGNECMMKKGLELVIALNKSENAALLPPHKKNMLNEVAKTQQKNN